MVDWGVIGSVASLGLFVMLVLQDYNLSFQLVSIPLAFLLMYRIIIGDTNVKSD